MRISCACEEQNKQLEKQRKELKEEHQKNLEDERNHAAEGKVKMKS